MDVLSIIVICVAFTIIFCALLRLRHLIKHTHNITDYLCVYNGSKKYSIISQRVHFNSQKIAAIRKEFRNRPIREQIAQFGREFEEDFDKLFDKLQPNVHYRVITHYKHLIENAVSDGRIKLISSPEDKKRRTLRELRPLLGIRDYLQARKCIRKNPHKIRCCKNCGKKVKCKCSRGGICRLASVKWFVQYDFIVVR